MQLRLRFVAASVFITVPLATSLTALALGMSVILWLLIGLGMASLNALTLFVICKQGLTEYDW